MSKPNIERNFKDFKKEIENFRKYYVDYKYFDDNTITSLKDMHNNIESLVNEWSHLEGDIEEAISFIDNIEE